MNDSQGTPSQTNGADEPAQVLPPVQLPAVSNDQTAMQVPDFAGTVPAGQTMPVDNALVPAPDIATDSDLIEKEWVDKAKQIVERTAGDPFTQQQELGKMKTEYMKKRYNKDIGGA